MTLDTFTHLIVRSLPSCRAAPSSTRKPAPGTVRLPESLIILEYLADVFPDAGLLPADPALRAKARLFAQTVETKFIPAFVGFLFMGAPVPAILGAVEALQSLLPAEGFAIGDWSIADAAFAPFFLRLSMLGKNGLGLYDESAGKTYAALLSERFARIQKWLADNLARSSMQNTWDEVRISIIDRGDLSESHLPRHRRLTCRSSSNVWTESARWAWTEYSCATEVGECNCSRVPVATKHIVLLRDLMSGSTVTQTRCSKVVCVISTWANRNTLWDVHSNPTPEKQELALPSP